MMHWKFSQSEKVYNIEKWIEIENQKILFENIKIYPTKSVLTVNFDKSNSKKIFSFEDLKLIDEKGEEWGRINNGMTGTIGEDSQTLYFQSNYFYKPKELYITGNSIRALNKNQCYFTVDLGKQTVSYSPNNQLSVSDFSLNGNSLSLGLLVKKEPEDLNNGYVISNEVLDEAGEKIEISSTGVSGMDKKSFMHYELKLNKETKGPLTFSIHDYPTKIKGTFKIMIPLD